MSGLKGQLRTPREDPRARRNADGLASNVEFVGGGGIVLTDDGELQIDLASDPGLELASGALRALVTGVLERTASGLALNIGPGLANSAGALVVDLAADPGLEFSSGDLRVLVAANGGISRTASGLSLPLTTKGDLLARTGSGTVRLSVGSDGQVLTADSSASEGVAWQDSDNSAPRWRRYTVGHADLAALGASTTGDLELFQLPAGGVIEMAKIKHSTPFAGGSVSALDVSVGVSGELDKYSSTFDVFQSTGSTTYALDFLPGGEDHGSATSIRLAATAAGDDLDQLTAGALEVWVRWGVASTPGS